MLAGIITDATFKEEELNIEPSSLDKNSFIFFFKTGNIRSSQNFFTNHLSENRVNRVNHECYECNGSRELRVYYDFRVMRESRECCESRGFHECYENRDLNE